MKRCLSAKEGTSHQPLEIFFLVQVETEIQSNLKFFH